MQTLPSKILEVNEAISAHEAFAELLTGINWDLFCTFTYSEPIWASEKVERDLKRTIRNAQAITLGERPGNKRFKRKWAEEAYSPWFIAIEKHKSGTLHAHALIGDIDVVKACSSTTATKTITREDIQKVWKDDIRNSGFTKIEQVRKNSGAVNYMIKASRYCTKNPESVLDWSGLRSWDQCHVADPVVC